MCVDGAFFRVCELSTGLAESYPQGYPQLCITLSYLQISELSTKLSTGSNGVIHKVIHRLGLDRNGQKWTFESANFEVTGGWIFIRIVSWPTGDLVGSSLARVRFGSANFEYFRFL